MACEYLSMEVMERWIISKDQRNTILHALLYAYMIHNKKKLFNSLILLKGTAE